MKKSMVLLIALLFISAISVLILKNLDDTNSYIKEQNHKLNKAQISFLLKNVLDEVQNVIKEHENKLEFVYGKTFPLIIKDIELSFALNLYDKVNINNITKDLESQEYKDVQTFFYDREITDIDTLRTIIKQLQTASGNINNNKQVDDIISNFIKQTYDKKILDIKEEIGFLKISENEKLYILNVNIRYAKEQVKARYILNGNEKVRYFELSFK